MESFDLKACLLDFHTLNHPSIHADIECLNMEDLLLFRELHILTQLNNPHIESCVFASLALFCIEKEESLRGDFYLVHLHVSSTYYSTSGLWGHYPFFHSLLHSSTRPIIHCILNPHRHCTSPQGLQFLGIRKGIWHYHSPHAIIGQSWVTYV